MVDNKDSKAGKFEKKTGGVTPQSEKLLR